MQNYDVAVKATNTSINSQGSAMQENARYLESAQAKVNKLKVAWEELALSSGNTVFIDMITMITSDLRYLVNSIDALISLDFSKGNLVAGFTMLAGLTGGLTTLMNGGIRNMVFSDNYVEQLQEKLSGVTGAYQEATKQANANRLAQQNAIPIGNQSITMMDKLKGSAHATAGGFRVAGAAVGGFVKTVGAAVATSLGIGVVIGAVTMAVGALITQFTKYRAEIAKKKQEQKELIKAYGDNVETIDMLADRYDALQSKTNRSAEETELMYSTAKSLGGYLPELVTHVDELGRTHLTSATSAKEYVNTLKEMQQLAAMEKLDKNSDSLVENKEKIEEASKAYAKLLEKKKQSDKEYAQDREMAQGAISDGAIYSVGSDNTAEARKADKADEIERERELEQAKMDNIKLTRERISLEVRASSEFSKLSGEQQKFIENMTTNIDNDVISQILDKADSAEDIFVETDKIKDEILEIIALISNVPSFDEALFKASSGSAQGEMANDILKSYSDAIQEFQRRQDAIIKSAGVATVDGLDGGNLQQYQALEQAKIGVANQGRAVVQAAESEKVAINDATAAVVMQNAKMDDTQRAAHSALAGVSDLTDGNNELADSAERAMTATQMLEQALGYQEGELTGIIDKAETYNDILFKMAEGHQFTASEMMQLIDKYPELIDSFEITNGVVSVNTGLVEELREAQRLQFEEKMKQASATRLQEEFTARFSGEMTAQRIAGITSIAEAEKALVLVKQEAAKEIAAIENKMNSIDPDDPNYGRQMYAGDMIGRINADFSGMDSFIQNMKKSEENARKIMATVTTSTKDLYNANKAAEEANKSNSGSEKDKQDSISTSTYLTNKYTEAIEKATAAAQKQMNLKNKYAQGSKAYANALKLEIQALEKQKKVTKEYIDVLANANRKKQIIANTGIHTSTTSVTTDSKGNIISTGGTQKDYDIIAGSSGFQKTGSKKLGGWGGINSAYGITRTINGSTWKHEGIDVAGKNGQRLDSNVNGTVFYTGGKNASLGIPSQYGNTVVIKDTRGTFHIYAHLNSIKVKSGQKIGVGEQIGTIGKTGNTTGAHLHYEQRSAMGKWGQNLLNPTRAAKSAVNSKQNTYTYSSGGVSVSKPTTVSSSSYLTRGGGGLLKGTESLFNKYGKQYGVDPALALAIAMHETGNGTSNLLKTKNNVGGMYDSKNKTFFKFDSIEQGIESMIRNLQKNYISQGLTTLESIQKKYAPNGAGNDPTGLNAYWVDGVSAQLKKLKGSTAVSSYKATSDADKAKDNAEKSKQQAERDEALAAQSKEEEAQRQALLELEEQRQGIILDFLKARADIYNRMYENYGKDEESIRSSLETVMGATRQSLALYEKVANNARLQTRAVELEIIQMGKDRAGAYYKQLSYARKAEFDARLNDLKRLLEQEKVQQLQAAMELEQEKASIREKLFDQQMKDLKRETNLLKRQISIIDGETNDDIVKKYMLTVSQEQAERKLLEIKRNQLKSEQEHLTRIRDSYGASSQAYLNQLELVKRYSEELLSLEDSVNSINASQKDMAKQVADDVIDTIKDALEKRREAEMKVIDDIEEKQMKALERERNVRKNAHEKLMKEMDEEREKMTEFFDERLKQLDKQDDERSHQKQMDDLAKREQDIRKQLNRISADDSFEAKAKRKDLMEQLKAIEEEREEYLYSRNLEKQKEAIEEERDAYEKAIDDKQTKEEEAFDKFNEDLDRREEAEKAMFEQMRENLNKHYDDILNDERRWNSIREYAMQGNFHTVSKMAEEMLVDTSQGFRKMFTDLDKTFKDVLKDLSYVYDDTEFMTLNLSESVQRALQDIVHTSSNSFESLGSVIQTNYIDKIKEALDLMAKMTGKDYDFDYEEPSSGNDLSTEDGFQGMSMYAKQTASAQPINVRSEADGKSKVIGSLVDGKGYKVLEQGAEYSKVQLSNGQAGWVSNKELSTSGGTSSWGVAISNTRAQELNAVSTPINELLKQYSPTANAHNARLKTIGYESGQRVYDDMVRDSTSRIKSKQQAALSTYQKAYESATSNAERNKALDQYVKSLADMQSEIIRAQREFDALFESLQGKTTIEKNAKMTANGALYANPYISAEGIMTSIPKGTTVKVLRDRGMMYEVQYGDKTGYVNKTYVGSFASGGWYTGDFEGGMPAVLHKKELVLDQKQTQNMLKTIEFTDRLVSPLRALVGKMQSVKSSTPVPSVHIENINNDFSNNEIKDGKGASEDFMKHTMNLINNKFGKR